MKHPSQRGFTLPEMIGVISLVAIMLGLFASAATSRWVAVQARIDQRAVVESTATVQRGDLRIPLWRAMELRRQHEAENP